MRNIILLIGTLLISGTISNAGRTQEAYSIVYDLYLDIMQYPENGNDLIARNQNIFGQRFYTCLRELTQKYMERAQKFYQYCDAKYSNPNLRARCYQENEPAKMYHWLQTIDAVTRNQIRWSDTDVANAAILAKRAVGHDAYIQIIRSTTLPNRPDLLCG